MSSDQKTLRSDHSLDLSDCQDQQFTGNNEEQEKLLKKSSTLYVGNLSFKTTEEQIYELFGRCGDIKNVFMGLDKVKNAVCGFCLVKYRSRAGAENAMRFLNGTYLNDRIISMDWVLGLRQGGRYGQGQCGGQVCDEFHEDFVADREDLSKQAEACVKKQIKQ